MTEAVGSQFEFDLTVGCWHLHGESTQAISTESNIQCNLPK